MRVAEDVASVVTVGYDQRLCLWDVHCQRGEATAGAAEDVQMEWICGAPVNVSDVGSLDVGVLGENGKHVCCVVGEGVQLFLCDAKN